MAAEPQQRQATTLTVRNDQIIYAIPVDVDGVEETLYTTDGMQPGDGDPIKLGGAWRDLDWEDAHAFFRRIDSESFPSEPLREEDF